MKRNVCLKSLSLFLAAVMMVTMLPLAGIVVGAATAITSVNDMGKLGSGFNMLGDKDIGDAPMRQVFVGTSGITAQFDSNPASRSSYSSITSVSEYFKNESNAMNLDFGFGSEANAKLEIKFVELNLSQKYKLNVSVDNENSSSSNNSKTTEYMILEYIHQIGTYSMWLDNENQIARLWQSDADGNLTVLNADFVDSLLNDEPEIFFKNYGSHLITRYTAGGSAFSSYEGEIEYKSSDSNSKQNVSVFEGSEGALTRYEELESICNSNSGESSGRTVKRGVSDTRGGTGNFAWDASSASAWAKTVDRANHVVLVDDRLKMLPMWELLIEDSQADRRIELEQYFNDNVDAQFAEIYSNYVYSPTENKDYSDYIFVRTAEEFDNIRNNLGGKYVLLNNIDLSGYSEWTPIGTKTSPFSGTVDGNGNTVSGLKITSCDTYAGLFGYSKGTVENLTVSGTIDAAATGENNDAYIGGIAGYNAGVISNCRNLVAVNGKINISDKESEGADSASDDFFTKNAAAIENAKQTLSTTLSNNQTVTVGLTPARLTGSASGITINVSGTSSNDPAYIVLENADITGTIVHSGDRKICVVSVGETNTVSAPDGKSAIDAASSDFYIGGNAALTFKGGKGSTGSAGGAGGEGAIGVKVKSLQIKDAVVSVIGGTGGVGGQGSAGSNGAYGSSTSDAWVDTNPHSTKQGNGTPGGTGGAGGVGGKGGLPISSSVKIEVIDGAAYFTFGTGGTGGKGGTGGVGGTGRTGSNADKGSWMFGAGYSYGEDGGDGGAGGQGGTGGNGGNPADIVNLNTSSIGSGKVFYVSGQIGAGGQGGTGGKGGTGGVGGSCDSVQTGSGYCGNSCTCGGHGGNGGVGGAGGKGGSGSVAGAAGIGGAGGAGGVHSTSLKNCSCCRNGSTGATGSSGSTGSVSSLNIEAGLKTSFAEYKCYTNHVKYSDISNLVSIRSAEEQALIEELVMVAGKMDTSFWIGLEIISYDSASETAVCQWSDGTRVKIVGKGANAKAYRIDSNGNVIGEVYVNFNDGEPNNVNNNEYYMHLTTDAKWNDNSGSVTMGYITETALVTVSGNTIGKNALAVGGICGYNAGTIKSSYNNGAVSADKAYSLQSGVSAYAGGISGYNSGYVSASVNEGAVSSLAVSDSMSYYADAYAYNIGYKSANGKQENCSGYATPVPTAYSANGLENYKSNKDFASVATSDSVKESIDGYWNNSKLVMNAVDTVEYIRGAAFDEDSLDMSYNGSEANVVTVRYNFYKVGTSTVTVIFSDGTEEYVRYIPVRVIAETPEELEIYLVPKTEFFVGDIFSSEGLALKLVFDNGYEKLISSKYFTVVEPDMQRSGVQQVSVNYKYDSAQDFSCTYDINVEAVEVVGIDIVRLPIKTSYNVGETIDLTGLEVVKNYNNGVSEAVSDEELIVTYDFSEAGQATVKLEYSGYEVSFECDVAKAYADGDVTGDGKVNMFDYIAVKSHCLNKAMLDSDKQSRADLNGDGKINMFDYIALKNLVVKG